MSFGLDLADIDRIKAVFEFHPEVEKAIIYGSRAKGDFRDSSDIDLCLVGEQLSLTLLNTISQEIDELNLPYLFDISAYRHIANPDLVAHIARVGKPIFQRIEQ